MNLRRRLSSLAALSGSLALCAAPSAFASGGLVAAYGFEESAGSAVTDASGTGNGGTIAGATRSASGRFGKALSFDGVNDRVNIGDSASLDLTTAMTLEAWVRPTGTSWRTVLLKERSGGLAYALYSSTSTNRPSAEGAGADVRGPAALPSNTWSHVATTYNGSTLRLFVNGTQVASQPAAASLFTSGGALRIGGNAVWGEYFKGLIDEVRVYNRALTAAEIAADRLLPVVDTQAPSAPGTLSATVDVDDVNLSWGAATDNVGVAGYRVYRDGVLLGETPETSWSDLDRPAGSASYHVVAFDDAGLAGPASNTVSATVTPDITPPTVSLPNLCGGATIQDVGNLRVSYADDRGPVTLRVELDGATIYGPLTTPSLSGTRFFVWNSRTVANGPHTMVAIARDGAGNETTSAPCAWNVANVAIGVNLLAPANGATVSGTIDLTAQPLGDGVPSPTLPADFVVFFVDGQEVGFAPDPFSLPWDSTTVSDGVHEIEARLYWRGYSAPQATATVQVTVDN